MNKAAEYRKAITALVGALVLLLASSGIVIDQPVVDFAIAVLTAAAVWRVPNVPADPVLARDRDL